MTTKVMQTKERSRGKSLNSFGMLQLSAWIEAYEAKQLCGNKASFALLAEQSGLNAATVSKIVKGKKVDHRSIQKFFSACKLELLDSMISTPQLGSEIDWGTLTPPEVFFGRIDEIEKLKNVLEKPTKNIIVIKGLGGNGKTTLASHFVSASKDCFEFCICRSVASSPDAKEFLSDLLDSLDRKFGSKGVHRFTLESTIQQIYQHLKSHRILMFIDNFEAVLDPENPGSFLVRKEGYESLLEVFLKRISMSSILLTTREKPACLSTAGGSDGSTLFSMQLGGIGESAALDLIKHKSVDVDEKELQDLYNKVSGNPMGLILIASAIKTFFDNNVAAYFTSGSNLLNDMEKVLEEQINRLTDIEKKLIFYLAVCRSPIRLNELNGNSYGGDLGDLKHAAHSLWRRSLTTFAGGSLSLQGMVCDYITTILVIEIVKECKSGSFDLLRSIQIVQMERSQHIIDMQRQFLLRPISDKLILSLSGRENAIARLTNLLKRYQGKSSDSALFVPGNLINLLMSLKANLKNFDFSKLYIRGCDFRGVNLVGVDFSGSELLGCKFSCKHGGVWATKYSFSGELLAFGDVQGKISIYDSKTKQPLFFLEGHTSWVVYLVFSENDRLLFSTSADCTVRVWDLEQKKCVQVIDGFAKEVWGLSLTCDPNLILISSDDGKIVLWNLAQQRSQNVVELQRSLELLDVAFCKKSYTVYVSSNKNFLKKFDFRTMEYLGEIELPQTSARRLKFSPTAEEYAVICHHGLVLFRSVITDEQIADVCLGDTMLLNLDYSSDGKLLYVSGVSGQAFVICTDSKALVSSSKIASSIVNGLSHHPTKGEVAFGCNDQSVRIFKSQLISQINLIWGYSNLPNAVVSDIENGVYVVGCVDGVIRSFDIGSQELFKEFKLSSASISSLSLSRDKRNMKSLAVGDEKGTVFILDSFTWGVKATFETVISRINRVAFNFDDRVLVIGGDSKTIEVRSCENWLEVCRFETTIDSVLGLSCHESKNEALLSGVGKKVVVVDLDSLSVVGEFNHGFTLSWYSMYLQEQEQVAIGCSQLHLWDFDSKERVLEVDLDNGQARVGAHYKKKNWLLTTDIACRIIFFSLDSERFLEETLEGHTGQITCMHIVEELELLYTTSEDGFLKVWDLEKMELIHVHGNTPLYAGMNLVNTKGLSQAQLKDLVSLGAEA